MKKMIARILTSVFMLALVACDNDKGQDSLNATVLEITDSEIIAECIVDPANQLTGKMLAVSKNVISASGIPKMEAGDEIRVVFELGKVDEASNPVKIEHVYAIYLLDEHKNVIPN